MPEEARLLVEAGIAHIVDDAQMHKQKMKAMGREGRQRWRERLQEMGRDVARDVEEDKRQEREKALANMPETQREKAKKAIERREATPSTSESSVDDDTSLLSEDSASTRRTSMSPTPPTQHVTQLQSFPITPTSSFPPFQSQYPPASFRKNQNANLPRTPGSYALYKYLHTHPNHTFYISPGLRFGCQYLVYPGDPLRFHSHFLACSWAWDETIELQTLVGGGRLGTGVKKGFLIGGKVEKDKSASTHDGEKTKHEKRELGETAEDDVRCFCIEWAGM